jgi:uncharacterized protein YcbK (DUF882 family)
MRIPTTAIRAFSCLSAFFRHHLPALRPINAVPEGGSLRSGAQAIKALTGLNAQALRHCLAGLAGHRLALVAGIATLASLAATGTQDANANGETRSISMVHAHTNESINVTYKQNGSFDSSALEKLNWFLRDWRVDEPISMSPHLFDILWYVHREAGASAPVKVMSAYRSPGTNAMLRRRSRAVAKESQHMRGNAMDVHIPGVSMAKVRELGMRLQRGGVGYYPSAGSPFVHLDVGSVRSWPRMPRPQLERLFPDGKTVHLPADGIPLANYQAALAEVQARGGSALDYGTVTSNSGKSLWALLFGGDEDEDTREAVTRGGRNTRVARGRAPPAPEQYAAVNSADSVSAWGTSGLVARAPAPRSAPVASAEPRPSQVAAAPVAQPPAGQPIVAPFAPPLAPAPQAAPAARVDIAALPVPPIRPRGNAFSALVALSEPLPPVRPPNLGVAATAPAEAAPVAVAAVPAGIAAPSTLLTPAVGVPVPPVRPGPPVALPAVPAQVAALPGIVSRPAEEEGLVRAYAAVAAPLPPTRAARPPVAAPVPAATAPVAPATLTSVFPNQPVAAPQPRPAIASRPGAPRRTDPTALVAARPAAESRPATVTAVAEPPVEREVKRSVVALSFSQGPAKGGSGSGGFGGSFIRPMGLSFSNPGE